jgi:hypothetical protein
MPSKINICNVDIGTNYYRVKKPSADVVCLQVGIYIECVQCVCDSIVQCRFCVTVKSCDADDLSR